MQDIMADQIKEMERHQTVPRTRFPIVRDTKHDGTDGVTVEVDPAWWTHYLDDHKPLAVFRQKWWMKEIPHYEFDKLFPAEKSPPGETSLLYKPKTTIRAAIGVVDKYPALGIKSNVGVVSRSISYEGKLICLEDIFQKPDGKHALGHDWTFGLVAFDTKIGDEKVLVLENSPSYSSETESTTKSLYSDFQSGNKNRNLFRQTFLKIPEAFTSIQREVGDKRLLIMHRHDDTRVVYMQKLEYGPKFLVLDHFGIPIMAFAKHTVDGNTIIKKLKRSCFTTSGRWTKPEFEYMIREAEQGTSIDDICQ